MEDERVNIFIKVMEQSYDGMTIKYTGSGVVMCPMTVTATPMFEIHWLFGKKSIGLTWKMVDDIIQMPVISSDVIYPLYREEIAKSKKLEDRKEKISKVLNR